MKRTGPALAAGFFVSIGSIGSVGAAASIAACGPGQARSSDRAGTTSAVEAKAGEGGEPAWQDALERRPEILLSLRPKALRADRICGHLLRLALEVARRRSPVVARTRALEAMEDADEVIVSLSATAPAEPQADGDNGTDPGRDIVAIVRGVRADVDPGALVDGEGRALWSAGPQGRVRELVHDREEDGARNPASLFELPGRTWVIASGAARARARDALAHPLGRKEPLFDPEALAILRIDGPSLVAHIPALRDRLRLAAVGTGLRALEIGLLPGVNLRVRSTLSYADAAAAAAAERALRAMKDAVARNKPAAFAWIADLAIEGPDAADGSHASDADAKKRIRIVAPLPPDLIDAWIRANSSSLSPPVTSKGPPLPPDGGGPERDL